MAISNRKNTIARELVISKWIKSLFSQFPSSNNWNWTWYLKEWKEFYL